MKRLVSERRYHHAMSFEIVKEWEDIFSEKLNSDIICVHMNLFIKAYNRLILYYIPFITNKKRWRLGFIFSAGSDRPFRMKNVIPIYIDFHPRVMDKVIRDTRKLPCFFVTSRALRDIINQRSGRGNCYFVPLSIPDQYIKEVESQRDIDAIQIGRKNDVLHQYMLKYCKEHENINYVYMSEDHNFEYVSTIKGNIGRIDTRKQYFSMLRRARISLVSSPGKDNSSRRYDESVDFFTPRFSESIAARCVLIGRYTENEECRQLGIDKICKNVYTYEEFEKAVNSGLGARIEEEQYQKFLKNNSTSVMFTNIMKVLDEKGFLIPKEVKSMLEKCDE